MAVKRLDKNNIRALGDGAACLASCAHCNGELELVRAELPVDPSVAIAQEAIRAEGTRTLEAFKLEQGKKLELVEREKLAAESRATTLEGERTALNTILLRYANAEIERDITELSGKKFPPADVETERGLARDYLDVYPKLVPVDPAKPELGSEIQGMQRWRARVAQHKGRQDLGMTGPSHSRGNPAPPAAGVDPHRVAGAHVPPPGGPAIPGSPAGEDEHGRTVTRGGGSLADLVSKETERTPPRPLDADR